MSACVRCGAPAGWDEELHAPCAPRYDTDWNATGPLIERYNITLFRDYGIFGGTKPWTDYWRAMFRAVDDLQFGAEKEALGPTPLIAACNLLLALYAAGKLQHQEPALAAR